MLCTEAAKTNETSANQVLELPKMIDLPLGLFCCGDVVRGKKCTGVRQYCHTSHNIAVGNKIKSWIFELVNRSEIQPLNLVNENI